ncbi:uncharacterized protein LOC112598670 [Melanaphis sacchari]|uniref:uncharacterized protein LOC112598670 n=1 Tax=Melanaphis sacchari TaxID=742174 RepID=UPI000DC14CFA|nr:uncharacterized protein LOC112598670 [Melanaphis sacchari]XP_025200986.1 uncharacterized protein LOC112598670 [Melanaphis sacchari]
MLQRSPSSRKRRAVNSDSRRTSVAFNLESQSTRLTEGGRQQQLPQHRRASIAATSPSDGFEMRQRTRVSPEEEFFEYTHKRSPRPSFVSESKVQYIDKSPRNSLVPDMSRSPRTSLVPSDHRKPPRLLPDEQQESYTRSSSSRLEVDINRSPRHSLTCEHPDPRSPRSPRGSMVPEDDYSELRSGLRLDVESFNRSPRSSTAGLDPSRSPKNSLVPDSSRSPRGSIAYDLNRSPRGSLAVTPDTNRSPRGSLIPDPGKSPRGSVVSEGAYNMSRSARSSIPMAESASLGRTPRGSIGSVSCVHFDPQLKLTRNSTEPGNGSPKGTLKDSQRSSSPYKNAQYTQKQMFPDESRRASSSVSQVSGDERKRLCEHVKPCDSGLTVYGSLTYQLNHANMESTGIFDFIIKALSIIHRTVIMTVILSIFTVVPLIMFVVGVEFVRDCPREPHIPVYMIVGGIFGMIKMVWLLCRQVKSLRYNKRRRPDMGTREDMVSSMGSRIASVGLAAFLAGWFALGNYWILSVYWPDSEPSSLYEPNGWCNRTLYVTSLVHLALVYAAGAVVLVAVVAVLVFQRCAFRFK